MNLTSPSQVKAWCIENGFHPNKTLGQNFLIDQNALKSIVDAGLEKVEGKGVGVGVGEGVGVEGGAVSVLEIGPGMGVLTEEMLKRGCLVTAIEKDPVLAERLAREAKAEQEGGDGQWWSNFTLITGDALDYLSASSTSSLPLSSFDCMISNLPIRRGRGSFWSSCRRGRSR